MHPGMNLFSELEGLHGEQLATAGLRLLLLRSQLGRNAFVELLNARSRVGLVAARSHFSCYTEYATEHDSLGAGRLDLVIELDSVVVGIEVKLAAEFQPQQPHKYLEEIQRVADGLSRIRRGIVRPYMAVLAPESRKSAVLDHLESNQVFISWEETITAFQLAGRTDPFVSVLVDEYSDFLSDHLHFLPRFDTWAPHLEGRWEPNGTDYHREFLRKLVSLLPNPGARVGAGDTWVGYYFRIPDMDERTWIGFIPATRAKEFSGPGALLVVSRAPELPESEVIRRIELDPAQWVDGRFVSTWRIPVDPSWSSPDDWLEVLHPFIRLEGAS